MDGHSSSMSQRYYRKIIRIRGDDSPNVKLGLMEILAGHAPSNRILVPGVLTYQEYEKRLATWDKIRISVGILAEFYKGEGLLLFPPDWLEACAEFTRRRPSPTNPKWMGCDPAEGGDKTCWSIIDSYGLIKLLSLKTPDTSFITGQTIKLMRDYNISPWNVVFDRGGGGKEHADRLNAQGYPVRSVAFGESIIMEPHRGITLFQEKKEQREDKYAYKNRRVEMYAELSLLCDPTHPLSNNYFAIPPASVGPEYADLLNQLKVFPRKYDSEGRMILPPKNKKSEDSKEITLIEMIGHSPDEADSLVLAVHARLHKPRQTRAGAV